MYNQESTFMEYSPEFENFEFEESEWSGEEEVFNEAELMELAGELMEVNSEAELDQFLGKLIKRVGRGLGKVVRSPLGRAVGGFLKGVAKRALPLAGTAFGGMVGGPLGASIGRGLASAGGTALGLEMEMLSNEDQEFEGAKQFVRMGGQAVKSAISAPQNLNPNGIAQQAVAAAAAKLAPGLMGRKPGIPIPPTTPGRSGRWVRKGRHIIIHNC
jgi:hypothetical protein